MLGRRPVLQAAAAAPLLAASRASLGQHSSRGDPRVFRFIPISELNSLDPMWIPAANVRTHGYLVFDTLYGVDANYAPQPQMVAGHVVEDDGRRWTLTLRPQMLWHDGTPVLARDCAASIRRWGVRDSFGQALLAATEEIAAPDDRRIVIRLKRPFALLPDALATFGNFMPAMMPERLALTDPFKQVTEMVGSGPYRYLPDERVPGARVAYARNAAYVPRPDGTPEWTAGPKHAFFERIEWNVIPDPSTAAAALVNGEADRWEYVNLDLVGTLKRNRDVRVENADRIGITAYLRMNQAVPPFDNPGVRQAVLGAVDQEQFMLAVAGGEGVDHRTGLGFFTLGTPMANDAGIAAHATPRPLAESRQALKDAGYRGEKVVLLVAADVPPAKAASDVCAELLKSIGMTVDYQAMDWGTVAQRRMKRDPVTSGGWSIWIMPGSGANQLNPAVNGLMRTGEQAYFGWPKGPRLESLREPWLEAPDLAAQQAICREIQSQAFVDLPMIPLGQYYQPTAYRRSLEGNLDGFATFWNVRRV